MASAPPLSINCREEVAHVLVVEDHPIVAAGLVALINNEADLQVYGEAVNVEEVLNFMRERLPDLLLVDLSLGATSGLEVIKAILEFNSKLRILVLSMHEELFYAERCLRSGALGYIMKEQPPEEIIRAARQVLAGNIYVSQRVQEAMIKLHSREQTDPHISPINLLSNRELEVLQCIGHGQNNQQIAENLGLNIKTVEAHRYKIKNTLKLRNSIELIKFAINWVERESVFLIGQS